MNKTIYVLAVNNYCPEILAVTQPAILDYAKKIGAKVKYVTERKFLEFPVTYEKFQLYELSKANNDDWSIFIDADCYVCNDFPDIVEMIPTNCVLLAKGGFGGTRFKYNDYMRRYDQHLDVGSWFFAFNKICRDLIKPIHFQSGELSVNDCVNEIFPLSEELNGVVKVEPQHLIDDYLLARNIAKYGLKVKYLCEIFPNALNSLGHSCHDTNEVKLAYLKKLKDYDKTNYWSLLKDHPWCDEIKNMMGNNV